MGESLVFFSDSRCRVHLPVSLLHSWMSICLEKLCVTYPQKLSSLTSEGGTKHKPARFENTENKNPFNSPLSKTTWARLYHSSLTSCFSHYYTTPVNILLHFLQSTVTFRVHGKLKVQNSSTFQGPRMHFSSTKIINKKPYPRRGHSIFRLQRDTEVYCTALTKYW